MILLPNNSNKNPVGWKFFFLLFLCFFFQNYGRFAHLWAEDRVQQVQGFVDGNPLNVIVSDMLKKYEGQTAEVLNLPERHIIGSIQINMGKSFWIQSFHIPT